jgi:hypothetical protein
MLPDACHRPVCVIATSTDRTILLGRPVQTDHDNDLRD